MSDADDYFKNLAKDAKADEKKAQEERQFSSDYTPIFWSGFQQGGKKVVRFRDGIFIEKPSDLKITKGDSGELLHDKYSGRIAHMAQLYNDSGKRNNFFVPTKSEDPTHIFWRLRETVLKREWVPDPESKDGKKKPLYVYAHTHPELVDRFLTNGKNHGISKNRFDRGWYAQSLLFTNVADPNMLKAHQERNSWALLSKNVNIVKSDTEGQADKVYYDWGVPSYGFTTQLLDLIGHYGALNSYDVLMERPSSKDDTWKIRNATKYKEEVPDNLKSLVRDSAEFSDEMKSWDLYNIEEFTQFSDDSKWFKAFKVLFQSIDLAFKTNFHDEMEEKARICEEAKASTKATEEKTNSVIEVKSESTKEVAPTRTRARVEETPTKVEEGVTLEKLNSLGYKITAENFTPEIQALISHIDDKGIVQWKEGSGDIIRDDSDCFTISGVDEEGFGSPENPVVDVCLACNRRF